MHPHRLAADAGSDETTFENCFTDGGVRAAYVDTLDNFSSDLNHLNVKGQAAAAELIWPVVVDHLELE